MSEKIAIIGGGAAGMMCAVLLIKEGIDVTVYEKNEKCGRKLAITGKGRCNVTNNCDRDTFFANIPTNPRFLYSAYSNFSPEDTMSFFEERGVALKTERGDRVFPVSDRAYDIVDALFFDIKKNVVHDKIKGLTVEDGRVTGVITSKGTEKYDRVVVATGGKSYPLTGSDGDGYTFAKQNGIDVVAPTPSLVPFTSRDKDCPALMGLSLKNVSVTVTDNNGNKVYEDFGELLFTHFGLSGPVILSASAKTKDFSHSYVVSIDLKPALDEKMLDSRLLRDFGENINRNYANSLNGLLPSKLIPVFVRRTGIGAERKINSITKEERAKIISVLKNFTIEINGTRPIDEAIITRGGINVKELDPKTMMTKKIDGLYFIGEVIDVDGYTGGFNLQIAFSTAALCAKSIIETSF